MPSSRASSDRTGSVSSHEVYKKSSLSSKADPNQALTEAQPSECLIYTSSDPRLTNAVASVGGSDMFSLRSIQHRDAEGKIIGKPPVLLDIW